MSWNDNSVGICADCTGDMNMLYTLADGVIYITYFIDGQPYDMLFVLTIGGHLREIRPESLDFSGVGK